MAEKAFHFFHFVNDGTAENLENCIRLVRGAQQYYRNQGLPFIYDGGSKTYVECLFLTVSHVEEIKGKIWEQPERYYVIKATDEAEELSTQKSRTEFLPKVHWFLSSETTPDSHLTFMGREGLTSIDKMSLFCSVEPSKKEVYLSFRCCIFSSIIYFLGGVVDILGKA